MGVKYACSTVAKAQVGGLTSRKNAQIPSLPPH